MLVKELQIGDKVVRTVDGVTSEYIIISIIPPSQNQVYGFIGKVENGSSAALCGIGDQDFVNIGSDWYSAKDRSGEYSFDLIKTEEFEICENCEKAYSIDEMMYDRQGIPICPVCFAEIKDDPEFNIKEDEDM